MKAFSFSGWDGLPVPSKVLGELPARAARRGCDARQVKRIPRPAVVLVWTVGAVALHAVPFQLSRPGGPARPASPAPAVRGAGLVTVAAGGALMAWAFAAHYQQAPQGWPLESGLVPGYLLRPGPYRLIRNPMYAGETIAWAG
jgi:protein-S-isoprenylcysteine O-methyltransferase Ste14